MEARRDSKAQRSQQNLALKAKAPIAANLEDCLQSFARLCAILTSTGAEFDGLAKLADDCLARLASWGHESGTSSKALDHALRFSTELRETTLDWLTDLRGILEKANDGITLQLAESLGFPPQVKDTRPDVIERDNVPDYYESDEEFSIDDYLEVVADIVLCLVNLLPNLLDPTPDVFGPADDIFPVDVTSDIEAARRMFPKADLFIIERLGSASWRRRQHLRLVIQRLGEKSRSRSPQRREQGKPLKSKTPFRRGAKSIKESVSGWMSDTGFSTAPSIFSHLTGFTQTTHAGTSIAETDDAHNVYKEGHQYDIIVLHPPDPPQSLDSSGRPFSCPYCGLEVVPGVQLNDTEDWARHVFQDLEPYLCTFERCPSSHKTYGGREEWFQHELECHRLTEVWVCGNPTCHQAEFETASGFENHVKSAHKEVSPSLLSLMLQSSCRRFSQKPIKNLPCLLCGYICPDAEDIQGHLAQHLEQFTLKTALHDSLSESDEEDENNELSGDDNSEANSLIDWFLDEQAIRVGLSEMNVNKVQSDASGMVRGRLAALGIQDGRSERAASLATNGGSSNAHADLADGKVRTEKSSAQTVRWNCPNPNPKFVGRQKELSSIQQFLTSTPGGICVLSGHGGAGKTAIATEYSCLYVHDYDFVFWVDAETAAGCSESYNHIAKLFNLGDRARDSDGLTVLVREYLTRLEKRWILIFDNVEKWRHVARYIPSNMERNRASILMTARKGTILPQTLPHCHQVSVEALTLEDSRHMLLQSMQPDLAHKDVPSHPEFEIAGQAATVVERLPLAISMVAGFARVSQYSLTEFLEIWEERKMGDDDATQNPIDTIWDIGIQELPLESRKMLDMLSFLDPDTIHHDLLVGDHKEPGLRDLKFLDVSQPRRYQMTLDKLSGRSLVTIKEKAGKPVLSMHRIVQDKVKGGFNAENHNKAFVNALKLVRKQYPAASVVQVPDLPPWDEHRKLSPHVLSLHRSFKATKLIKPSFELAELLYDAGFGVWACETTTSEGIELLETAESILDALREDPNCKLRADIASILGHLLELTGASGREESFRRRQQARAIRDKIFAADPTHKVNHILLQNANNDYAISLLDKNRFDEAGEIFERCFEIYQKWDEEKVIPYEYAKYHHNNSMVQMARGQFPEAIKSVRHAIHLTEGFSGKQWRYWQFQYTLACILLQAGDLQGALDLHLEILSGRLELYGNKYERSTNMSKYAVGAMYHHLGDLPTATDYLKECVEDSSISNSPEEALARARFHLARLYMEQNLHQDEAVWLKKEALEVLEKYRPDLSDTDDIMMLLDNLQPVSGGRFTSRVLLQNLQLPAAQHEPREISRLASSRPISQASMSQCST
ncbi:hypothetical protein B0H66DRAFT_516243 [Apodospora peruviana]|uniref:C2H2-type domain-containing protein n=1 Tax=Apodospora peruviana TaxID=516989 RepID=A0AAE0I4H8_9PEZI|nr:hypothetical protein B0H66DRAFT_516243 [Apodospora peruviana]